MLVDRVNVVEKYFNNKVTEFFIIKKNFAELEPMFSYATEKYGLPAELFRDYITQRKPIEEASEFILYAMLASIKHTNTSFSIPLDRWFSEKEINDFENFKMENENFIFPLKFDMIPITDDQWIGRIDVNKIKELCDAQMINYNPDTQRSMQKVIRNGNEEYIVTLNKGSVNKIKESFDKGIFIPNTITLNIPVDSDAEFYYDLKEKKLVITKLEAFDINDGYHRFISMLKEKTLVPEFNYPMELRITYFDIKKSQQFIYQEDQKTKMKRVDSDSYNVYSLENVVVAKINENPSCNIRGFIGRNDARINAGNMARIVKTLFLPKFVEKTNENKTALEISRKLIDKFNLLTETDTSFLDIKYTNPVLTIVMSGFHYYDGRESEMVEGIKRALENKRKINNNVYQIKFYKKLYDKIVSELYEPFDVEERS